jgi:116 kDa U5 small nuclear ribonucleoprotein component
VNAFADRLWGDIYYNTETRKFTRKPADPEVNRSFVHFILEPLYKLYSNVLSEDTDTLKVTLDEIGIRLKPVMYKMDVRPLLKAILDQFFGPSTGLVDVIVNHIPSPSEGASSKASSSVYLPCSNSYCCNLLIKIERTYTGPQTSGLVSSMKSCDANGPVMIQIAKLYHTTDAQSFRAFGRVLSGTVKKGMAIKVLGEGYSPEDEEDMMTVNVDDIWISESR